MYFQSVTDNAAYCDAHVLSFQPLLERPVLGEDDAQLLFPGAQPLQRRA